MNNPVVLGSNAEAARLYKAVCIPLNTILDIRYPIRKLRNLNITAA